MVSHNPHDIREGYCGACHDWTGDDAPPEGVRITRADGSVIECDVLRDPGAGRDGCARWIAVPRSPFTSGPGDSLEVDVLPVNAALAVRLTRDGNLTAG
jgi:hypothetical protein